MFTCFHCNESFSKEELSTPCPKREGRNPGNRLRHQVERKCLMCPTTFLVSPFQISQKLCSKECSVAKQNLVVGVDHPCYGTKRSPEVRANLSEKAKERFKDPKARFEAGKSNRGKHLDNAHLAKYWGTGYPHTPEAKIKIGVKSRKKFTPEYNKRVREKNEKSGLWLPQSEMEDFALYLKLSEWKSGYNLIPYQSEEAKKKVSMLGIYNPKTNKGGLVRDHRLSRKDGFKLKCFPELLRHPANCQFITNSENAKKQCHSDIDVDTLLSQVLEFQPTWVEQEVCVKLVERYHNGERYERHDY